MKDSAMLGGEQSDDVSLAYVSIKGRAPHARLATEITIAAEEMRMKKDQAKGRGKKAKGKGKEGLGVPLEGKGQKTRGVVDNNLGDTAFPGPLQG
jgi:hypothetical protein